MARFPISGQRIHPRTFLCLLYQFDEFAGRVKPAEKFDGFLERVYRQMPLVAAEPTRKVQFPIPPILKFTTPAYLAANIDGDDAGAIALLADNWLVVDMNWGHRRQGKLPASKFGPCTESVLAQGTSQRGEGSVRW